MTLLGNVTVSQIVLVAGGLFAVWLLLRRIGRVLRKLTHVYDDWIGTPARDGVPARLGVIAQLYLLQTATTDIVRVLHAVDVRLADVEHELHPNSGKSARDVLDRIEQRLAPADADATQP